MLVFFIAALVCVLGLMFDPGDAGWLAWSLFITGFLACAVWNWWRKPLLWRRKCKAFNENLIAAFKAA